MFVPTKTFKMSKRAKTSIARVQDQHARGSLKRALIQAQMASEVVVKKEKESR